MNENNQQPSWHRHAANALAKHSVHKGIGTTLSFSLFFVAYFYLLKHPVYPAIVMPFTWIDSLISFQPLAMPLYLSLWVYVSLPTALLETRHDLNRYASAMAGTCLVGLIIFLFWPTIVPAADIDWAQYPAVDFLKKIDAAGNAFPSLHVATAVFSGIWLHYLLRRFGAPVWIHSLNGMWCIGIVYSTLATRQHVAVDVLDGLALGGLAAWLSLRNRVDADVIGKPGNHTRSINE